MALGKDPLVITVDGLDIVIEETAVPAERVKVYMPDKEQHVAVD
jgi:hypothetical protein